jgi:K+-transporting ATPase ATPase A chain
VTTSGLLQLVFYLVVLIALAKPLGAYMARVYSGQTSWLGPLERLTYRLAGIRATDEMSWKRYALAMLLINFLGVLVVYALQRLQGGLPLNPQGLGAVSADSSFNTAVSFATNTNWQGYGGETTMSYLTQMVALTVQNFVSASAGMACLAALIRAFARRSAKTIGNFWVDLDPHRALHHVAPFLRGRPHPRLPRCSPDLQGISESDRVAVGGVRRAGDGQGR